MLVLLLALLAGCCAGAPVTVVTRSGPVVGVRDSVATSFLNIPFAAPPVGALRWAAPVPVAPWTAPRDASQWGPGCPQTCQLPPLVCPSVTSEDCLQLNVFVPNNATGKLPVAVFLPGGNFRQGAASTLLYDSRYWVAATPFVMVTVNYRLGALGWLVQDGLPRNLGIQDQRLALQWVADNIGAFGGDAEQVTLMGQSAGGTSIGYHLLSNKSGGLFHRVVSESNPLGLPLKNPEDGRRFGDVFMKHLKCGRGDVACLRKAAVPDIVAAQDATNKHFSVTDPLLMFYPWTPVVDEADGVSKQPIALLIEGRGRAVPSIFGTVANESVIFIYLAFGDNGMSPIEYEAFVLDTFPLHARAVLRQYPTDYGGNSSMAASYLATDLLFTCANRAAVRGQSRVAPVHLYKFDHALSFGKAVWGDSTHCYHETCHAGELPFLFNPVADVNISMTPQEQILTAAMQSYWTNFFYTGDPGAGPFAGQLPSVWPAYAASSDTNLRITTPACFAQQHLKQAACDFWDAIGYDRGEHLLRALSRRAAAIAARK